MANALAAASLARAHGVPPEAVARRNWSTLQLLADLLEPHDEAVAVVWPGRLTCIDARALVGMTIRDMA